MAHDGLGETVGWCLGVFYAADDVVVSLNSDWLQHAMNLLVGLFRRYVMAANVTKSHTMTCHPSALQAGVLEEAMVLKCTGLGDSFQVRLRRWIPCPECGAEITEGSMTAHHSCMYRTEPAIYWSRLPVIQTVRQHQVYDVRFPRTKKRCPCLFPGCPGFSHTCNGLGLHFSSQNCGDRISLLEEHPKPLPRCE